MLIAGIVLQVGVRHERNDSVEDHRRAEDAAAQRVQRRDRLQAQHHVTVGEQHERERQHGDHVLFPVLLSAVDLGLEPRERGRCLVAAVYDHREISTERDRQENRHRKQQNWQRPHGLHPISVRGSIQDGFGGRARRADTPGPHQNHSGRTSAVPR
jgi:hypothetical protein